MQVVVASVKKKWSRLILSGDKTIELRKNFPVTLANELAGNPFVVLFYETRADEGAGRIVSSVLCTGFEPCTREMIYSSGHEEQNHFVFNQNLPDTDSFLRRSCLTREEIKEYSCGFRYKDFSYSPLFGWLLSDMRPINLLLEDVGLKSAPQSWSYTHVDAKKIGR